MMLITDYKIMYVIISQVMFKNKTEIILIYGILQKVTNTRFW